MPEQVNIASLTIDVDDVIKESVRLQKEMDRVKDSQKDLDKSTEEGAAAYAKSAAELKNLSKAYKDNQTFAAALDATNEDLNKTMQVQGKSTQELYDSRRQLNVIAKNIKGDTEEEIALRDQLNTAIDEQTEALREQQSTFNAGKDQIGEYTQGINASDLSLQNLIKNSEEAGGATNLLSGGLKAAKKGIISFTKSTLAFLATPVGVVLAVIAGAFLLIKNAMNRSEESTARVKKAFSGLSGVFKFMMKLLEPLGKFLIDGLVKGFELVEKVVTATMRGIQKALDFLGFDIAAAGLDKFNKGIEENIKASKDLVEAELDLAKAQRIARKTQLEFLKQAEKLRQIRDDETKSTKERIKANEELGRVLDKQLKEELNIAQKALDVADLRIKLEGETTETLDEQADALTEIADIEERITGQVSEQLVNRVALQKEAADKIREIQEAEADASEEAAKKKMEADKEAAEAAIELARFELNEYIRANKSKLDSDKFLTDESVKEEVRRLEALAEKRREHEALRLEEGTISEIEYNEAIAVINEENQIAIDEANLARKEAENEQRAIDAENEILALEAKGASEYEVALARLENLRKAELQEAEKTGASKTLIDAKYSRIQEQLSRATTDAKIDGIKSVLDTFSSALAEQTIASKAAAIASTLISTYQSAVSAFNSLASIPVVGTVLGIAAAGLAVASGLKQVSKIRGTSTQFSKGDILKGRSHANNGIPFSIGGKLGFEAEGGEALINKNSTSMFAPLLSAINVAGGGRKFAAGGIAGTSSGITSSGLIDYDLLALRIAEANKSLPNPVVSVEEITEVATNITVVENLATA
jgi:hypothetical protein